MWLSGKEPTCRCRRLGFCPWVRDIPWRRKWQPTPVFLLGNPMDRGTWKPTVQGGAKSRTQLTIYTLKEKVNFFSFFCSLPVCYFGCSVFMLISVCLHGQTKVEQEVLLCVIQGLHQRRGCLFTQSDSMVKRQVPGPWVPALPLIRTQGSRDSYGESKHPWDTAHCLQPSSWTHPALVSLHSKCLALWRSSCLRKEGLRVELKV